MMFHVNPSLIFNIYFPDHLLFYLNFSFLLLFVEAGELFVYDINL